MMVKMIFIEVKNSSLSKTAWIKRTSRLSETANMLQQNRLTKALWNMQISFNEWGKQAKNKMVKRL